MREPGAARSGRVANGFAQTLNQCQKQWQKHKIGLDKSYLKHFQVALDRMSTDGGSVKMEPKSG